MRSFVTNQANHGLLSWGLSATLHVATGVAVLQWAGSPPIGLWQQSVVRGQAVTLMASIATEESSAEQAVAIDALQAPQPTLEPLPAITDAGRSPPSLVGHLPSFAQVESLAFEPRPLAHPTRRAAVSEALPKSPSADHKINSPSRSSSARVATSASVAGAQDDIPRQLPSNTAPEYPAEAIAANWEGSVLVQALISAEGSVLRAQVARTSGFAILDASAVKAVKQWRFSPARRQDRAVEHEVLLPIRFRIDRG